MTPTLTHAPGRIIIWLLLLCVWVVPQLGYGQGTIVGQVKDKSSNTALIGARILLKTGNVGAMSDDQGQFQFKTTLNPPFELQVTYFGYDTLIYQITTFDQRIRLEMEESSLELEAVEITTSAMVERQRQSPLSVESMGINAIKETPAANFYDGLGALKGVDLTAASIGFKVINTRGFNSAAPVRSLQIIDGMDDEEKLEKKHEAG